MPEHKVNDCFEKIEALWKFVEKKAEVYDEAIKAGKTFRKGNLEDIEKLVTFLRTWNQARGWKEPKVKEQLKTLWSSKKYAPILREFNEKYSEGELNEAVLGKFLETLLDLLRGLDGATEIVGTIKLAHVLYPDVFPLLDNPIAKGVGMGSSVGDINKYLKFKRAVDKTIERYCPDLPEEEKYKRIDEMLYLWYTWKQDGGESLKELLEKFGENCCANLFENIVDNIQMNIQKGA